MECGAGSVKRGPECTRGPRASGLQALAGRLAPSVCLCCQGDDPCGLAGERAGRLGSVRRELKDSTIFRNHLQFLLHFNVSVLRPSASCLSPVDTVSALPAVIRMTRKLQ